MSEQINILTNTEQIQTIQATQTTEQNEANIFSKRFLDFIDKIYDEKFFNSLSIEELKHYHSEALELQQQYKNLELIVKKDANSLYGTSASIYYSLVDFEVAGDITGTGEYYAKLVDKKINEFFVNWGENELKIIQEFYPNVVRLKKFSEYVPDTKNDVCTYGDTDSRYINLGLIYSFLIGTDELGFEEIGKLPPNNKEGNHELGEFAIFLMKNFINDIIKNNIEEDLNFRNGNIGYLRMAHEVTTRRCVFQAKKKYVLATCWKDGKHLDKIKLKVLGVELKQGGLNERMKKIIEKLVTKYLVEDFSQEELRIECIKLIAYIRKRAEKSFIYRISSVSGLKEIHKNDNGIYVSTKNHIQIKMALYWFNFIESNNMNQIYQRPFEGQKMNFYYGMDGKVVAVPDDVDIDSVKGLPEPDWNLMLGQILVKNLLKYISNQKEFKPKDIENFLLGIEELQFGK